jgi:putative endonuclease
VVSVSQATGRFGEQVAERHLIEQGMVVLERRWRCTEGEVDLIVRDGGTLVFVEVKARNGLGCGRPVEAVTPTKLRRLRRLAGVWLSTHQVHPDEVRIDVVGVLRDQDSVTIEHLRGVG